MVALKAYFDDSGDADSQSETHLTIGGWLAEIDGWQYFEPRWKAVLDDSQVPYLHLNEFTDPGSAIYGHLKAKPEREKAFLQALWSVIREAARGSVATTVLLDDLQAFNAKHGLKLDAYAIAIYGCLFQLRSYHPNDEIELVFDTFDNSPSRIAKALAYAKSDTLKELKADFFTPILLQKHESWRTVLPLQAADWNAWEVRKYRRERPWRPPEDIRPNRDEMIKWGQAWEAAENPRDRGSFQMLRQGLIFRPIHIVMDTYSLNFALERHPNGWGE